MADKKWIDWNGECPNCGNGVEILTDAVQDHPYPVAYDGDEARCVSCKWRGSVDVAEDNGRAWLNDGNLDELDEDNLNPSTND